MLKLSLAALALLGAGAPLVAQETVGRCLAPDSVTVVGNRRVPSATILSDAGLTKGMTLNFPTVQRAIKNVFQGGQFDDVSVVCSVDETTQKSLLTVQVVERPILSLVDVIGPKAVSANTVKDKVDLLIGRPVDPSQVARAVQRIDSVYLAEGYYLARIRPETTMVEGRMQLIFRVDEGHRLAISGIKVVGNAHVSTKDIAGAMKTRPEGFGFWQRGEFNAEKYAQDVGEKVPELFGKRGFIDFQVLKDTLMVDRERGKGMVELTVKEGPQYKIGAFEVIGNRRFSSEEIARFYPFTDQAPTLTQRVTDFVKRRSVGSNVFDKSRWETATSKTREAYANEGYIYAQVRPIVDRHPNDSVPTVNLRWDVTEGSPAIINRIEIAGNDFTSETCIRDQLLIIPGDVFNQDRLLRSYQNIQNLGFFESPLPPPDTRTANDQGDVDVIFKVKEKRTGNVNFGASMGQGTGLGGFIGLEQPNLFGKCKKGSIQWQFGRYINDFNMSYTDPAIKQSRISGTVSLYNSQSRYRIADLGQNTRIGGNVRIGFPFANSRFTRVFVSYGAEGVRYGSGGLLGTVANQCAGCFRSTIGFDITRDTRVAMPFPADGTLQSLSAQFNGGPLGGTASFQRYTSDFKSYTTLFNIGGKKPGTEPLRVVAGLSQRAGMLFGDSGPFFFSQQFSLGGVQFGEPLRGYPEFSLTPTGFNASTGTYNASRASFGSAFFSGTAEVGLRVSSQFYVDLFYDAGNIWNHPRDFNPTRLYRGAGIGVSTVTPLGPLGLDWAYGFDRVNELGKPDPKWQLHFRLGQFFQ
jgi:outer membrane protein insertion porin family